MTDENAASELMARLTAPQLAELDRCVLARTIVLGIKHVRAALGCDLGMAQFVFQERYNTLRHTRPGDFTHAHDEYRKGFYS